MHNDALLYVQVRVAEHEFNCCIALSHSLASMQGVSGGAHAAGQLAAALEAALNALRRRQARPARSQYCVDHATQHLDLKSAILSCTQSSTSHPVVHSRAGGRLP